MTEQEFYTDELEQLLKEKADQFRMYPSRRVWHSIYNNLHPGRRWPSIAISMLLVTSLMFIGYLNTSDNEVINQRNENAVTEITAVNSHLQKQTASANKLSQHTATGYKNIFENINTNETDFFNYTLVKNNLPNYNYAVNANSNNPKTSVGNLPDENNSKDLIQAMDIYIKSNQIFADVAVANNKNNKPAIRKNTTGELVNTIVVSEGDRNLGVYTAENKPAFTELSGALPGLDKSKEDNKPVTAKLNPASDKNILSAEEKAWIENYALQNIPARNNKWKARTTFEFYITPAVNYRKLTSQSKGSATPFANSDINRSISQKPGVGFEAGAGLSYSVAKNLRLKAGLQFNYNNYNINADQTTHPILTTILLNDPNTGYSYPSARTSTTANSYNSTALQPITLHNRTYQISVPVGLAYKLSSKDNVDWFAGATIQPTYVFGGNAHIISSDLKSYVSDPSSIRPWNLNLGFETYMNFKLGGYNLQVGPQVRYQIYSTYTKNMALIEKPYAIGLKFGLTKGF